MSSKNIVGIDEIFMKGVGKTIATVSAFQGAEVGMRIEVYYIYCAFFSQCQALDVAVCVVVSTTDNDCLFTRLVNQRI